MLSVERKRLFITLQDIYFAQYCSQIHASNKTDILIYTQCSEKEKSAKDFHTLVLDLTKEETQLLSEMKKETRGKLHKAEREDNLEVCIIDKPSLEDIKQFKSFYDTFAKLKKLKRCDKNKLIALKQSNALAVSIVKDAEGKPLCCHTLILNETRIRALYSASYFRMSTSSVYRNFIGRANKYLHWTEIKYFKAKGYELYDLGGIAADNSSEQINNITRFKEGFGGSTIIEYNCYKPITFKGKIALMLMAKEF